jgi:hypothetical protein
MLLAFGVNLLFFLFLRDNKKVQTSAATPQINAIIAMTITAIAQPGKLLDEDPLLWLVVVDDGVVEFGPFAVVEFVPLLGVATSIC